MVKITLQIEGMACGMCQAHINDAIRRRFAVKKVTSSHSRGETVILAENPLEEDALKKVVGETGYTVVSVRSEPYQKRGWFRRGNG